MAGVISRERSEALFAEALRYIPGGVNSPVRAFRAVGGRPFFVHKAAGCRVWDVDGNEYLDYVGTWGPAILGHAWRTGHVQISAVRLALPADLPAGDYALEMSLFDPNQKKNAVYFDPRQPNQPIVTIRKTMRVLTGD